MTRVRNFLLIAGFVVFGLTVLSGLTIATGMLVGLIAPGPPPLVLFAGLLVTHWLLFAGGLIAVIQLIRGDV